MKRIFRIKGQAKVKDVGLRGVAEHPEVRDADATVALIQALIPLGPRAIGEALEAEATQLAGTRYSRTGGQPGLVRWSQQRGSVYLADQKLPLTYARVRGLPRSQEVPLATAPAVAGAPGGRCRPVPEGPPGAELPERPSLRRGGAGGVRAQSVDRLPAVHPGQRPEAPGAQEL